jgi:hypothetical protein
MATATKVRTLRYTETAGGPALVIREQTGDVVRVEAYYLSQTGGTTRFTKSDGTVYLVQGAGESCNCPARFHGPKVVCRHRAAVKTLLTLGRLPVPAAVDVA